jgi:hypothetical protein
MIQHRALWGFWSVFIPQHARVNHDALCGSQQLTFVRWPIGLSGQLFTCPSQQWTFCSGPVASAALWLLVTEAAAADDAGCFCLMLVLYNPFVGAAGF